MATNLPDLLRSLATNDEAKMPFAGAALLLLITSSMSAVTMTTVVKADLSAKKDQALLDVMGLVDTELNEQARSLARVAFVWALQAEADLPIESTDPLPPLSPETAPDLGVVSALTNVLLDTYVQSMFPRMVGSIQIGVSNVSIVIDVADVLVEDVSLDTGGIDWTEDLQAIRQKEAEIEKRLRQEKWPDLDKTLRQKGCHTDPVDPVSARDQVCKTYRSVARSTLENAIENSRFDHEDMLVNMPGFDGPGILAARPGKNFYHVQGEADVVVRDVAGPGVLTATARIDTLVFDQTPFLLSRSASLEKFASGENSEVGRLARYMLTTLAQLRVMHGFGMTFADATIGARAAKENPHIKKSTEAILTEFDVTLATKIAMDLAVARQFRVIPAGAEPRAALILQKYRDEASLDAADALLLLCGAVASGAEECSTDPRAPRSISVDLRVFVAHALALLVNEVIFKTLGADVCLLDVKASAPDMTATVKNWENAASCLADSRKLCSDLPGDVQLCRAWHATIKSGVERQAKVVRCLYGGASSSCGDVFGAQISVPPTRAAKKGEELPAWVWTDDLARTQTIIDTWFRNRACDKTGSEYVAAFGGDRNDKSEKRWVDTGRKSLETNDEDAHGAFLCRSLMWNGDKATWRPYDDWEEYWDDREDADEEEMERIRTSWHRDYGAEDDEPDWDDLTAEQQRRVIRDFDRGPIVHRGAIEYAMLLHRLRYENEESTILLGPSLGPHLPPLPPTCVWKDKDPQVSLYSPAWTEVNLVEVLEDGTSNRFPAHTPMLREDKTAVWWGNDQAADGQIDWDVDKDDPEEWDASHDRPVDHGHGVFWVGVDAPYPQLHDALRSAYSNADLSVNKMIAEALADIAYEPMLYARMFGSTKAPVVTITIDATDTQSALDALRTAVLDRVRAIDPGSVKSYLHDRLAGDVRWVKAAHEKEMAIYEAWLRANADHFILPTLRANVKADPLLGGMHDAVCANHLLPLKDRDEYVQALVTDVRRRLDSRYVASFAGLRSDGSLPYATSIQSAQQDLIFLAPLYKAFGKVAGEAVSTYDLTDHILYSMEALMDGQKRMLGIRNIAYRLPLAIDRPFPFTGTTSTSGEQDHGADLPRPSPIDPSALAYDPRELDILWARSIRNEQANASAHWDEIFGYMRDFLTEDRGPFLSARRAEDLLDASGNNHHGGWEHFRALQPGWSEIKAKPSSTWLRIDLHDKSEVKTYTLLPPPECIQPRSLPTQRALSYPLDDTIARDFTPRAWVTTSTGPPDAIVSLPVRVCFLEAQRWTCDKASTSREACMSSHGYDDPSCDPADEMWLCTGWKRIQSTRVADVRVDHVSQECRVYTTSGAHSLARYTTATQAQACGRFMEAMIERGFDQRFDSGGLIISPRTDHGVDMEYRFPIPPTTCAHFPWEDAARVRAHGYRVTEAALYPNVLTGLRPAFVRADSTTAIVQTDVTVCDLDAVDGRPDAEVRRTSHEWVEMNTDCHVKANDERWYPAADYGIDAANCRSFMDAWTGPRASGREGALRLIHTELLEDRRYAYARTAFQDHPPMQSRIRAFEGWQGSIPQECSSGTQFARSECAVQGTFQIVDVGTGYPLPVESVFDVQDLRALHANTQRSLSLSGREGARDVTFRVTLTQPVVPTLESGIDVTTFRAAGPTSSEGHPQRCGTSTKETKCPTRPDGRDYSQAPFETSFRMHVVGKATYEVETVSLELTRHGDPLLSRSLVEVPIDLPLSIPVVTSWALTDNVQGISFSGLGDKEIPAEAEEEAATLTGEIAKLFAPVMKLLDFIMNLLTSLSEVVGEVIGKVQEFLSMIFELLIEAIAWVVENILEPPIKLLCSLLGDFTLEFPIFGIGTRVEFPCDEDAIPWGSTIGGDPAMAYTLLRLTLFFEGLPDEEVKCAGGESGPANCVQADILKFGLGKESWGVNTLLTGAKRMPPEQALMPATLVLRGNFHVSGETHPWDFMADFGVMGESHGMRAFVADDSEATEPTPHGADEIDLDFDPRTGKMSAGAPAGFSLYHLFDKMESGRQVELRVVGLSPGASPVRISREIPLPGGFEAEIYFLANEEALNLAESELVELLDLEGKIAGALRKLFLDMLECMDRAALVSAAAIVECVPLHEETGQMFGSIFEEIWEGLQEQPMKVLERIDKFGISISLELPADPAGSSPVGFLQRVKAMAAAYKDSKVAQVGALKEEITDFKDDLQEKKEDIANLMTKEGAKAAVREAAVGYLNQEVDAAADYVEGLLSGLEAKILNADSQVRSIIEEYCLAREKLGSNDPIAKLRDPGVCKEREEKEDEPEVAQFYCEWLDEEEPEGHYLGKRYCSERADLFELLENAIDPAPLHEAFCASDAEQSDTFHEVCTTGGLYLDAQALRARAACPFVEDEVPPSCLAGSHDLAHAAPLADHICPAPTQQETAAPDELCESLAIHLRELQDGYCAHWWTSFCKESRPTLRSALPPHAAYCDEHTGRPRSGGPSVCNPPFNLHAQTDRFIEIYCAKTVEREDDGEALCTAASAPALLAELAERIEEKYCALDATDRAKGPDVCDEPAPDHPLCFGLASSGPDPRKADPAPPTAPTGVSPARPRTAGMAPPTDPAQRKVFDLVKLLDSWEAKKQSYAEAKEKMRERYKLQPCEVHAFFAYTCVDLDCTFSAAKSRGQGNRSSYAYDWTIGTQRYHGPVFNTTLQAGLTGVNLSIRSLRNVTSSVEKEIDFTLGRMEGTSAEDEPNAALKADFTFTCDATRRCTLDASSSTGAAIYSWQNQSWSETTEKPILSVTLSAIGEHNITLTVERDPKDPVTTPDDVPSLTRTIQLGLDGASDEPPRAAFTYNCTGTGTATSSCTFEGYEVLGAPNKTANPQLPERRNVSYAWEFPGGTRSGREVTQDLPNGTHKVLLTVSLDGISSTTTREVTITGQNVNDTDPPRRTPVAAGRGLRLDVQLDRPAESLGQFSDWAKRAIGSLLGTPGEGDAPAGDDELSAFRDLTFSIYAYQRLPQRLDLPPEEDQPESMGIHARTNLATILQRPDDVHLYSFGFKTTFTPRPVMEGTIVGDLFLPTTQATYWWLKMDVAVLPAPRVEPNLLARFAPLLKIAFHDHTPIDVDAHLTGVRVVDPDEQTLTRSLPEVVEQRSDAPEPYRADNEWDGLQTKSARSWLAPSEGPLARASNGPLSPAPTVYGRIAERDRDCHLQYFMLFPRSDWEYRAAIGTWQLISIVIGKDEAGNCVPEPRWIVLGGHRENIAVRMSSGMGEAHALRGERWAWDDTRLDREGERVVVRIAEGSHALSLRGGQRIWGEGIAEDYPTADAITLSPRPEQPTDRAERIQREDPSLTQSYALLIRGPAGALPQDAENEEEGQNRPDVPWLLYQGRWGPPADPLNATSASGSRGPAFLDHGLAWDHPHVWALTLPRAKP